MTSRSHILDPIDSPGAGHRRQQSAARLDLENEVAVLLAKLATNPPPLTDSQQRGSLRGTGADPLPAIPQESEEDRATRVMVEDAEEKQKKADADADRAAAAAERDSADSAASSAIQDSVKAKLDGDKAKKEKARIADQEAATTAQVRPEASPLSAVFASVFSSPLLLVLPLFILAGFSKMFSVATHAETPSPAHGQFYLKAMLKAEDDARKAKDAPLRPASQRYKASRGA